MGLQLILGRAGAGKTHTCWEEIKHELAKGESRTPLILLVPEQATFQNELALASLVPGGGILRAQVLSFQRLAYRVLQEVGGCARVHLDELGKKMIIRELLEQHKGKLRLFSRAVEQPGFVDSLAETLSELKSYCISPQKLADLLQQESGADQGVLQAKLHDLHLIYGALEEYLATKYLDPDGYLLLLAERLEESTTVAGAKIWLDGFTGFTPAEYQVLEKILQRAEQVKITLCLDPRQAQGQLRETELFYATRETMKKLESLAHKAGVKLEPPLVLADRPCPHRFRESKPLAHLENYFFQRPAPTFAGEPAGLKLVAAANRRAEVEAVAREILRLCREEGYRFRDVALILRELEPYEQLIRTVFADYGIPFFIDQKRSVMHHPLVELIRSALEVLEENWAYEPVFRYLKTDLVPISREQVDLLENYVLAHGLRGKSWTQGQDWTYRRQYTLDEEQELTPGEEQELKMVNEAREVAARDLLAFSRRLKKCENVRQMAEALFKLLVELDVPHKLNQWCLEAQEQGRLEEAQEHAQVWSGIVALLDQMVEALGEEKMSLHNFRQVLEAGLENLRLGLIPPGLDQVLVNNLEHSRNPKVRGAFVLGINDGVYPLRLKEEGLLSEREREGLSRKGLELAPGSKRRLFEEQYLIYMALTRASHYLWLSYPLADEEGKALMPAVVIARVKELFPDLQEKAFALDPREGAEDAWEFISHPDRTLAYLAAQLREAKAGREISPLWWQVYNYFVQEPSLREKTRGVLAGLFHVNNEEPIPASLSRGLYGHPYKSSVSRLERFAACPFQHFLSYGLKLQERSIYKLEAPDLGQFFHAALKLFVDKLQERGLEWGNLNRRECEKLTEEVVGELAPKLQNEILLSTARHRHLTRRLQRTVERAALVLTEHARRGSFRPIALELDFGPQGKLPPLVVDLGNGLTLELTGRIDRVDLARCGEKNYLRVIDYKSGFSKLSLSDIFHGIKLQLLAYLDVVLTFCQHLTGEDALPAGVLYFSVKDPLISAPGPLTLEQVEQEILKKLKMQGYVVAEAQVVREMDRQISGYSQLIPAGLRDDDTLYANSSALTLEQFQLLRQHLQDTLKQLALEILNGNVKIQPFQKKGLRSCQYCQYKAVCHFDPMLEDNTYRILSEDEAEEIWLRLKKKGGESSE